MSKREVEKTELFVPNYVETGYRHAVLSRIRDIESRCLGYCHTDEGHYYSLLRHYEPIIQVFVAVSGRCKARLVSMLPHRQDDVHIVPYGVPVLWEPRTVGQNGSLRLLYAGRLVKKQKRILDFIELIKYLEDRRVDYSLDFVGTGPDEDELKEQVRTYSRIRLLRAVPYAEMPRLYPDYDVLVLTSESEGLSIAMLEAMSFGVVPVVTRVSGAEDIIINGENGFLCDVGHLRAMSDCLEYLACNRGRLAAISKQAFELILTGYTVEKHLMRLRRVIDEVMIKPLATTGAAAACL